MLPSPPVSKPFGSFIIILLLLLLLLAGYSLNALVDFPADDPIEVIKHLIIGSEGTLGFVSQVRRSLVL
jgi:FAD/FMN-containing dehydrogenase